MEQIVKSPVTGTDKVKLIKKISVEDIIKLYPADIQKNIKNYFKDLEYISVYLCQDSGYIFYYPFYLQGDSKYYESINSSELYYMKWKWEHQIASLNIGNSDKVFS